jgi:hypothetical protein
MALDACPAPKVQVRVGALSKPLQRGLRADRSSRAKHFTKLFAPLVALAM